MKDWVRARTECTPENVFEQLREVVETDYETHCEVNPPLSTDLEYKSCEAGFYVKRGARGAMIYFSVIRGKIVVERITWKGDRTPMLKASVELDRDCNCCLVVGDSKQQYKLSQFSREALENLFFRMED